jgi:enoyl-CoA hydratase
MSDHIEITLDGPGKNALGTHVMQATLDSVRSAKGKPILLTGKGDAFSAGLNIKEIATLDGPALMRFLTLFDELVVALVGHDAPLVAALNGHAIAGGCILTLCADYRIATSNTAARIGLNEVQIGLEFPPRALRLVRARVYPSGIFRVLLEAGTYPPAVAKELGLIDEVANEPLEAGRSAIARLSAAPRKAYLAAKKALTAEILHVSDEERRSFETELLPAWIKRKEELLGVLAR